MGMIRVSTTRKTIMGRRIIATLVEIPVHAYEDDPFDSDMAAYLFLRKILVRPRGLACLPPSPYIDMLYNDFGFDLVAFNHDSLVDSPFDWVYVRYYDCNNTQIGMPVVAFQRDNINCSDWGTPVNIAYTFAARKKSQKEMHIGYMVINATNTENTCFFQRFEVVAMPTGSSNLVTLFQGTASAQYKGSNDTAVIVFTFYAPYSGAELL